jgi:hypothetical protein
MPTRWRLAVITMYVVNPVLILAGSSLSFRSNDGLTIATGIMIAITGVLNLGVAAVMARRLASATRGE